MPNVRTSDGLSSSSSPKSFSALLSALSPAVAQAVIDASIFSEGGDFSWLDVDLYPRLIQALNLAEQEHGGKRRRLGGQTRLIHELWCAHQVWQFCKRHEVAAELAREGVAAEYVTFGMIVHDAIENSKRSAELVRADIARIWNDVKTFGKLNKECLVYMTDRDSDLPNELRIPLQKAKSFQIGLFILTPSQQIWRMFDKLHHVVADSRYCRQQLERLRAHGTDQQRIELKELAQTCLADSLLKSFPLEFPLGKYVKAPYESSQRILARIAGADLKSVYALWTSEFKLAAARSVNHLQSVSLSAWEQGARSIRPLFRSMRNAFTSIL